MDFKKSSEYYSLNKLIYINLRWIAIIGQFLTINSVKFIFDFEFDYIFANIVIAVGILSNLYLIYFNNNNLLHNKTSFIFLTIDIILLGLLLYLTGGVLNPFSVFLLIPSVFGSTRLSIKISLSLVVLTITCILFLTFFHQDLPYPLNSYKFSNYYYYAIPIALIIALIFLNYFALIFGKESNLRKEALDKIQEVIAKEHELVSLGGQAAAAAHSLGTPLSTIKIISQDLYSNFKNSKEYNKDIELLLSQVNRCDDILKKLTLNPTIEDKFIDKDLSLYEYVNEIVKSFEEISNKNFVINTEQNYNSFNLRKSIELVYGIRNFVGNANKFSKNKIFITIKSDSEKSEIIIEDDGPGFTKDILNKIGEPYIKSVKKEKKPLSGLGLGIFIGKTLLEKNLAKLNCRNSETRGGAEINISWANKDLIKI
tara:strand:+ start:2644 stop:3921 length:1278 start_codon:yes stop_codon:yes gene_type:complete